MLELVECVFERSFGYTLIDGRPKKQEPVPQEVYFGLVRWSTLEPKPAYAPLRGKMLRKMRNETPEVRTFPPLAGLPTQAESAPAMLTMLSLMTPLAILPSRLYVHCTAARDDACRCFPDGTGLGATVQSSYDKSTNLTSGFAVLDITTVNKSATPRVVAYAAGLAEGYQTADEIALFFTNVYEFGRDGPSAALTKFVHDNDAWTRQQVADHADESDYWMAVGLVLDRFDGTFAGYKKAQAERPTELPPLTNLDMLWINLDGDLCVAYPSPPRSVSRHRPLACSVRLAPAQLRPHARDWGCAAPRSRGARIAPPRGKSK